MHQLCLGCSSLQDCHGGRHRRKPSIEDRQARCALVQRATMRRGKSAREIFGWGVSVEEGEFAGGGREGREARDG